MLNQPVLSRHEVGLLRGLMAGRERAVPSSHRLRFEMLGLIRDRPNGIELTPVGRQRAQAPWSIDKDDDDTRL